MSQPSVYKVNLLSLAVMAIISTSTLASQPNSTVENKPQVQGANLPAPSLEKPSAAFDLPEPLTLKSLLALPETVSPQLIASQSRQAQAQANYALQDSADAVELNVLGRIGWREYADHTEDNHLLALHVGKKLYDFGQTQALIDAQEKISEAQTQLYEDQVIQFQIQLMQTFFNVILADFQYRIENESMAVAYVALDKAKDRYELNRISDVDYLKLQADYQKILVKRSRAEYEQRRTRNALANLVGQPSQLPDKLIFPRLKSIESRELNELEKYQDQALANNLQLKSMQLKLQAAQHRLEGESATDKPTFRVDAWGGKLSTYEYQREGRWRFDLSMDYPLYDGGARSAKVSLARADIQELEAQVNALEQHLRDQVADLYFKLKLSDAEKKQNKAFGDYADLYLDYSRALYENESTTDLGDSMVRLSEANFQVISQQFKQALYWAQLDYLTGTPVQLSATP
ncbi:TolC family protein [Hydrogenovibrio sp. 3SP14C1]|uniref:TolC family protein n=1 Tax=Hydrogenovibrio sp. 3SP14C1 TaxID=3038774 RepID=UPI002416E9E3|nr:TolC family protein [Hydrogenovibrio sp. 3SP14C1]MDG4811760.1 TolC family protein [Hydrogenovibrio sp. 3SP14C1]